MDIEQILRRGVECGASDIFVVAGLPLTYKVQGEQVRDTERYTPQVPKPLRRRCIGWQDGSRGALPAERQTMIFPFHSAESDGFESTCSVSGAVSLRWCG